MPVDREREVGLLLRGGFNHPGDDAFLAREHETNSNTEVNQGSIVHSSGRLDDELLFYLDCETELQPKINILRSSLGVCQSILPEAKHKLGCQLPYHQISPP